MEFDGIVEKDKKSKYWIIEIPALELMTQGTSKQNAFIMIKDAIRELVETYFGKASRKTLRLSIDQDGDFGFGLRCNQPRLLLSLALRRQREASGLTIREVSANLGSKYPNAYAQYEKGTVNISLDKYEALLLAANPDTACSLRIG